MYTPRTVLSFDRPLGVVAGLVLYGDHADPRMVHVLPTRPRVVRSDEASSLSLVKLRGVDPTEADGAGLLTFAAELAATEDQLEEARRQLEEQGIAEPTFAPVWARAGKAMVVAALEEGDGFVETMFGEATPDLLADNRAPFSILLGETGVKLVEAMLEPDGVAGLGVRYELEVVGLRPALDARLRADYGRLFDELAAELNVGVAHGEAAIRAGLESTTRKLVESKAIEIEVIHFSDDADLRAKIDQALQWFQDEVVEKLFKPRLSTGSVDDLLNRARQGAASMGSSLSSVLADPQLTSRLASMLGVTADDLRAAAEPGAALELELSLRQLEQEERRVVELDWSESRPEVRTLNPQGMLTDIGPTPRIVEVEPRNELWAKLDVTIEPRGDLAALGVERMVVRLAHPNEDAPEATREDFVFAPDRTEPRHFAAWTDGGPRQYRTQTEVAFAMDGPWPGPPTVTGPWRTSTVPQLAVHPLSGVPRVDLEIARGEVSFEETPKIQVELRMDGEPLANEMLTEETPRIFVRRRLELPQSTTTADDETGETETPAGPAIEAQCTWLHADGLRTEGPWEPVTGSALLVGTPWRSRRVLRLLPVLAPGFVDASVTLTMVDGNDTRVTTVSFAPTDRRPKVVTLPSTAEEPPPVQVEVVVVKADHSAYFSDPVETTDPVVVVRDRDGEQRRVEVRLVAGPRLADHGVLAVQVEQLDATGEVVDSILFTQSRRDPAALFVPIGDDGNATLRHRIIRYAIDGTARISDPGEEDGARLLVPAMIPPQ